MDERQRSQIALIIAHELDLALRGAPKEREQIFAANSARGIMASGATIKQVIAALEAIAEKLLSTLVSKCGTVVKDPASFLMIEEAMASFFNGLDTWTDRLMHVTGGKRSASIAKATQDLFDQARSDIGAKVAIEKFAFDGVSISGAVATDWVPVNQAPVAANKGGKPLAAHWDEMWSWIAVQLYVGDLQPKTQADIERAMTGWFVDNSIDAGESTIRDRARQLWRKLQATA